MNNKSQYKLLFMGLEITKTTLFLLELGLITFLFFNYVGWNDLSKIAEINPTLDDPFTLLSIVLLPRVN